MISYFLDLLIISVLIIGITATMGVFSNGVAEKLFGKKVTAEEDHTFKTQAGWKTVGGKKQRL